jgi:hypothetical protein
VGNGVFADAHASDEDEKRVGKIAPISGLPEIGIKKCADRASPICVRFCPPYFNIARRTP